MAPVDHRAHDRPRRQPRALEVDVHDPVEVFLAELVSGTMLLDAGARDDAMHVAEPSQGFGDHLVTGGEVAYVDLDREGV